MAAATAQRLGSGVGSQIALPYPASAPVIVLPSMSRWAKAAGGGAILAVAALVGGYLVFTGKVKIPGISGVTQAAPPVTGTTTPTTTTTTGTQTTTQSTVPSFSIASVTAGQVKVGSPVTATVIVTNNGGGVGPATVSGVIVGPEGKVDGHFTPVTSGGLSPNGTAPLVITSEGDLSSAYGGKSIRLGFRPDNSLTSANIGAPAPSGTTYVAVDVPAVPATVVRVTNNPAPTQPIARTQPTPTAPVQSTTIPTHNPANSTPLGGPPPVRQVSEGQLVQIGLSNPSPYVSQLAKTYMNPGVTSALTSSFTSQANSAGASDLISQYNTLGTEITKLRALVGLQQQTGLALQPITYNGRTYSSATQAWTDLAAQQSQIDQDIQAKIGASKPAQPSSPSNPSPTQAVSPGTVLQPYGSHQTFTASAPTMVQPQPPSNYQGSTTFTPTTSGGIFVHGANGTGFYAPPGSSVYNSLVNGSAA